MRHTIDAYIAALRTRMQLRQLQQLQQLQQNHQLQLQQLQPQEHAVQLRGAIRAYQLNPSAQEFWPMPIPIPVPGYSAVCVTQRL
jgi:hypothetical protein